MPLYVSSSTIQAGGTGDSASSAPEIDVSLMNGTHTVALWRAGDAPLNWAISSSNTSVSHDYVMAAAFPLSFAVRACLHARNKTVLGTIRAFLTCMCGEGGLCLHVVAYLARLHRSFVVNMRAWIYGKR